MRTLIVLIALCAAGAAYAEPVTYRIDPAHTQVSFSINRFGFNNVLGRFDGAQGTIVLDEAAPENSSVQAVIQTGGVTLGDPTRDQHVREAHWLNTAEFPTITFTSTSVRLLGEHRAEVTGQLSLLGQTHPMTLDVQLNRIGALPNNQLQGAGFSATGRLSRSAWGSRTAPNLIGDDVIITIEALGYVPREGN